jgi:hypothetical protein
VEVAAFGWIFGDGSTIVGVVAFVLTIFFHEFIVGFLQSHYFLLVLMVSLFVLLVLQIEIANLLT